MTDPNGPDFQPTLRSTLVTLRPITAGDWDGMLAAAADPLVWEVHPVHERYKPEVFRDFFEGGLASTMCLTIVDARTDAIIGSSRYHAYDPVLREVEIGWTFLARSYWGGIYNREIKRLMLVHAFHFVESVVFMVGEHNARSQRAMEKVGGVRRAQVLERAYQGKSFRHVVFEIRKPSQGPWSPPAV